MTQDRQSRDGGDLGRAFVADMEQLTLDRNGEKIVENIERNAALLNVGQSLAHLRGQPAGETDSALVIAAGPSVKRRDPLTRIRESGYRGAIIATDSAMYYCLRNGVVPDLVVSLDPHATRIVRWFGDPHLTEEALAGEDYFRRQDMDPNFAAELETNKEMLALLDEHGSKMRIALCTSTSEAVANRAVETGMSVYWWNPMLDDPADPDGLTAKIKRLNGLPAVNAGGNVGAACWMMAHAVLGKRRVGLTGMDFSYYADTPYSATQYYHEIRELVGEERLDEVFMHVHNPYLDSWFYTDPAYMWYCEAFLEMAQDADCETYNCTEGGILFGEPIHFQSLDDFLAAD